MTNNDLKRWMRLCEGAPQRVRVFHGTETPPAQFHLLPDMMYGVRNFGFAASYALRREHPSGYVLTLDFTFQNLCREDALAALFEQHGIEPWPSAAGVFIQNPEFMDILTEAGFDGLYAHDFGFRDDFEELPVYMVVNAAKQARVINATPITRKDLQAEHEPEETV